MGAMLAGDAQAAGSFYVDFGIAAASIPVISYVDVLAESPSALARLKDKKVIVGGTAVELGDRMTTPRGRIIPGPILQAMAADSILQGRALQKTGDFAGWIAAAFLALGMLLAWPRTTAKSRAFTLIAIAFGIEGAGALAQAYTPVIWDTSLPLAACCLYLLALALDEIDFRGMLRRVSDNRFQRITMALTDGLVTTDRRGVITLCNPAAAAMFGYQAGELIGAPVSRIVVAEENGPPLSIDDLAVWLQHSDVSEAIGLRKSGAAFPLDASCSSWESESGRQFGIVMRDASVRRREAEKIRRLAEYDTLTGLANRNTFHKHISARLSEIDTTNKAVALLLFDLDKFKEINDTLGHLFGDKVLEAVARRIESAIGAEALVARLGGDEFAIVLCAASTEIAARAEHFAAAIVTAFGNAPLSVERRQLTVKASVGIAIAGSSVDDGTELMANADLALYQAKANGRDCFVFFEQGYRDKVEERLKLEGELARAVKNGEFELFYQPQVDLKSGRIVGAEALIRWRHPQRGFVSPGMFMPIVNSSVLSNEVATWVIADACRQGALWQREGLDLRIGVNLSPSLMHSGDLPAFVERTLEETGYAPDRLELEVTEDIVINDEAVARKTFEAIQKLGVKLAFDDFGTGYGSLSYLRTFRLDVLKIDRSFVSNLATSADDMSIVASIISLSHQLGLTVIAEGIEDASTVEALRTLGCDEVQGYFFGKPMPAAEFAARCRAQAVGKIAAAG
jgi:diguanylate cyclase (GGDEF)-like protein/PAS domain S-box-containing protein